MFKKSALCFALLLISRIMNANEKPEKEFIFITDPKFNTENRIKEMEKHTIATTAGLASASALFSYHYAKAARITKPTNKVTAGVCAFSAAISFAMTGMYGAVAGYALKEYNSPEKKNVLAKAVRDFATQMALNPNNR